MPSVTPSTSRRRTAHTTPSPFNASSTTGAEITIDATSPATSATTVLTISAPTIATEAPHSRACTRDARGSGSTRSSHDTTGSTIASGTSPASADTGSSTASSTTPSATSGAQIATGMLTQRGRRGLRAGAAAVAPSTNVVHAVPFHHRQPAPRTGSGYHPAGGFADGWSGTPSSAHARAPTNASMWNRIWSGPYRSATPTGQARRAAQPSSRQSGATADRTCPAQASTS